MNNSNFTEERVLSLKANGLLATLVIVLSLIISYLLFTFMFVFSVSTALMVVVVVITSIYGFVVGPLLFIGLKVIKPNEALVLTLFGRYYGTIKEEGFYWVHPLASAVNPLSSGSYTSSSGKVEIKREPSSSSSSASAGKRNISLKAITLNNDKQKVNDALGNPIIIGVVVVWRVIDTAKAVFNVENYVEYLSIQCDAALRNVVRDYPYDSEDDETSLRGSATVVAERITQELQEKVGVAGLEILESRITHLSYAPEIATAMLQRQQATAMIAARQKIVEGAVGMVEMALTQLNEGDLVNLDEERKANMVSNLLVVLCGNRDVQPVVNSGTLY